jgi:carbon-monoxide dehydrogenase medium subunit
MITTYQKLPDFVYVKPNSLYEASQFLLENSDTAAPFLGGTDLFIQLRNKIKKIKYLIDLKEIEGLNEISYDAGTGITIGASVNLNRLISSKIIYEQLCCLHEACESVGSYQLRNRATIIGNICNASPAGDTIGACILLDAELNVYNTKEEYRIPISNFFLGPGVSILNPGEIVTSIHFPSVEPKIEGKYIKLGRNKRSDLAIIGVSIIGHSMKSNISGFRIRLALTSAHPTPIEILEVEKYFKERKLSRKNIIEVSNIVMEQCRPIDDIRGSKKYRKLMVRNLTQIALNTLCERLDVNCDDQTDK